MRSWYSRSCFFAPRHTMTKIVKLRNAPTTVLQEAPSKIAMIKRVTARTPKTIAMLPLIGAFPMATMSPIYRSACPKRRAVHPTTGLMKYYRGEAQGPCRLESLNTTGRTGFPVASALRGAGGSVGLVVMLSLVPAVVLGFGFHCFSRPAALHGAPPGIDQAES